MNESGKPNLYRLLKRALDRGVAGVRISMPGVVVSYDKTKQRASIQPAITDGFIDEDGTRKPLADPILNDVPIAFPGSGGYGETWPIAKGDTVLIVWCSRSIARWKPRGSGDGRAIDPGDDRRHAIADAIAYPGVRDFGHALASVDDDAWCIRVPSGKFVKVGGPAAASSAVKGEQLVSAINTLAAAISAQIQVAANSGIDATAIGIAMTAAIASFNSSASAYLSNKVKIE